MSTPSETTLHPFYETLGPGPYRFVGCYDLGAAQDSTSAANFGNLRGWLSDAPKLKAGLGTCAHCGTASKPPFKPTLRWPAGSSKPSSSFWELNDQGI